MSEMVERVARALCDVPSPGLSGGGWDNLTPTWRQFYLDAARAAIDTLSKEQLCRRVVELEAALKPFVDYRAWARRHDWPVGIANDPHTPVWGHEQYDDDRPGFAVYVRDFDRAAAVLGEK